MIRLLFISPFEPQRAPIMDSEQNQQPFGVQYDHSAVETHGSPWCLGHSLEIVSSGDTLSSRLPQDAGLVQSICTLGSGFSVCVPTTTERHLIPLRITGKCQSIPFIGLTRSECICLPIYMGVHDSRTHLESCQEH